MNRSLLVWATTLLLVSCGPPKGTTTYNKVIEASKSFTPLGVPVPEGTQYSQDCKIDGYVKNIGFVECLIYPISDRQRAGEYDLEQKKIGKPIGLYVGEQGYELGKRNQNHMWFEKVINKKCNRRLLVLYWYHSDLETASYAIENNDLSNVDHNSVIFIQAKDEACGEQRLVK